MKDFYVVCCKDHQSDKPDFVVQQHIKPVFDSSKADSLCTQAAHNGNMDEDYAVFHISLAGAVMIGEPIRGLSEL